MFNGRQNGPVTLEQLRDFIRRGRIPGDTVVWRSGMEVWLPANSLPEFKDKKSHTAPPMDVSARVWYYEQGGKNFGPFSAKDLRRHLAAGSVPLDVKVWNEGMDAWTPANEQAEFADIKVKKRSITRPPIAPHQVAPKKRAAKQAAKKMSIGQWLSIEGYLTIATLLIVAGLFIFQVPARLSITYGICWIFSMLIGFVLWWRALCNHWVWMLVVIFIPFGELLYALIDIQKCWRALLATALAAGLGYYVLHGADISEAEDQARIVELRRDILPFELLLPPEPAK